jgi:hypothetical protein
MLATLLQRTRLAFATVVILSVPAFAILSLVGGDADEPARGEARDHSIRPRVGSWDATSNEAGSSPAADATGEVLRDWTFTSQSPPNKGKSKGPPSPSK